MITPETQTVSPSRNARVIAVLCELWCWLGPLLVLSLIVRLTTAKRDPFLRAVTGEVLNLQLAALLPLALVVVALAVGWSALAWAGWMLWMVVVGYGYVVGVIGAMKGWGGAAWPYPLNLRLVPRS